MARYFMNDVLCEFLLVTYDIFISLQLCEIVFDWIEIKNVICYICLSCL